MSTRFVRRAAWGAMPLSAILVLAATAASAVADSPSELLEKAIYTEETVGNLDEAMKLYEEVIAEARTGQEAAAEAQYRLGLCHLKKGDEAAARAAFESLRSNYPEATELIAKASMQLPSGFDLLPAPWVDGEHMQLNMKLPSGVDIGTMVYMVDSVEHEGRKVTRCRTRGLVTANDANSYSQVLCDPESFAPIRSFWKHSMLGEATAEYGDTSVEITIVGKKDPVTIDFAPPVFDNEECVELFRRLPLAVGYQETIPIITTLGGNKIELPVNVSTKETITVPAGTFECYKIELKMLGQTFWISTDEHRYVVRFVAGGVTADLTKVWQGDSKAAREVEGERFSFTLPESWLAYQPTKMLESGGGTEVFLLDPTADSLGELEIRAKDTLDADQQASSLAWTKSVIGKFKNVFPDFTLRKPEFQETKLGGVPATMIVADFNHKGQAKTLLGIAAIGDKSAATLRLMAEGDKFDELRKGFDEIVNSFEFK